MAGEVDGAVHPGQGNVKARPVLLREAESGDGEKVNQTLPGCRHMVSRGKYNSNLFKGEVWNKINYCSHSPNCVLYFISTNPSDHHSLSVNAVKWPHWASRML